MSLPTLKLRATPLGPTTILLWCRLLVADDRALTADQTITVTVTDANDAPVAVGTIDPVTLTVGDEEQTLDVSDKFSDPDGDALTYSAQSADTNVAMVGVENAIITITPGEAGTTTVTVTAFDAARLTATQPIAVTVVVAKGSCPRG